MAAVGRVAVGRRAAVGHTVTITYGSTARGGPGATSPSTTGEHRWVAF